MMKVMKEERIHEDVCRTVEFDPTSNLLCTSSFDQTVSICESKSLKTVATFKGHQDKVISAKWHPFYPFIISASLDKEVKIITDENFMASYRKRN